MITQQAEAYYQTNAPHVLVGAEAVLLLLLLLWGCGRGGGGELASPTVADATATSAAATTAAAAAAGAVETTVSVLEKSASLHTPGKMVWVGVGVDVGGLAGNYCPSLKFCRIQYC